MAAKLYVIPGSHPAMTGRLLLERKGIEYKRVDLVPVVSRVALKLIRFPQNRVPALTIEGRRLQGSRELSRELDLMYPEPPLFPADPGRREAVEEAERWGDEVLQDVPRQVLWWALRRDRAPLRSFSAGAKLGVPIGLAVRTAAPIVWMAGRLNDANDDVVRDDLARLPELLDRIDEWIADGVIGGPEPNAADFQIATSIRLLMTLDDLRPMLESRPAGELAMRVCPDFPGHVPAVLPAGWLEPLRASAVPA